MKSIVELNSKWKWQLYNKPRSLSTRRSRLLLPLLVFVWFEFLFLFPFAIFFWFDILSLFNSASILTLIDSHYVKRKFSIFRYIFNQFRMEFGSHTRAHTQFHWTNIEKENWNAWHQFKKKKAKALFFLIQSKRCRANQPAIPALSLFQDRCFIFWEKSVMTKALSLWSRISW